MGTKVAAVFTLFTAGLLLFFNIYPLFAFQDMVFAAKRRALHAQATAICEALSPLEPLTAETVAEAVARLNVPSGTGIRVVAGDGVILFDSERAGGRHGPLAEVAAALEGQSPFFCVYSVADGAFTSRAAALIFSRGTVAGAVLLCDQDTDQGAFIEGLRRDLAVASLFFGGAGLVITLLLAVTLALRIKRLTNAMGVVRRGDYSYRIPVHGQDELSRLTAEFNMLTDRLESTEEARRRFVSDASHELRTPLAAIRLLSDSIAQADNMDPATMREFSHDIAMEADRLQRITEKLMSLSKLDSGTGDRQREPVDLKIVAERTLHLLEPLAAAQQVTIAVDLDEGCIVEGAADDLYQIVFNLTENGLKYNLPGGRVDLRLRAESGTVVLTVADTGIGIPEADLRHIFDRFYRVDKARSRASGGSGLGLAIVHDAVAANGGTVWAAHRAQGGTVFTVTFRLWKKKGRR